MKAVLISIQPKWVKQIHNGEKKWELRTTMPQFDGHTIKVFTYETKSKSGRGKIVSEWELNTCFKFTNISGNPANRELLYNKARVTEKQLFNYSEAGKKTIYAWQIDDLKIYDNPKKITEFRNSKNQPLTRPPQSWCYVEE